MMTSEVYDRLQCTAGSTGGGMVSLVEEIATCTAGTLSDGGGKDSGTKESLIDIRCLLRFLVAFDLPSEKC